MFLMVNNYCQCDWIERCWADWLGQQPSSVYVTWHHLLGELHHKNSHRMNTLIMLHWIHNPMLSLKIDEWLKVWPRWRKHPLKGCPSDYILPWSLSEYCSASCQTGGKELLVSCVPIAIMAFSSTCCPCLGPR